MMDYYHGVQTTPGRNPTTHVRKLFVNNARCTSVCFEIRTTTARFRKSALLKYG